MSTRRPSAVPPPPAKSAFEIDLALQGGGSHGAYTWGVLDALLEDGRFVPVGVSGTSAGALNAAALATGFARGGHEGAREALRSLWNAIGGTAGCFGSMMRLPGVWQGLMFNPDEWPGYSWLQAWSHLFSPYQTNPLGINPLRLLVERHVDIEAIRSGPVKLFITATAVRTGQAKVFDNSTLTVQALLASACLPQMNQAVEIDGQPYWDGGFSGNPALWPLIYGTSALDVVLVQINPLYREATPRTVEEINDRLNEITFNASLVSEMRAIAFVRRLVEKEQLDPTQYKTLRLHRVFDEEGLAPFDASSKVNTDPRLLDTLFSIGRASGLRWLAAHGADVGVRSTVDIEAEFLAPR